MASFRLYPKIESFFQGGGFSALKYGLRELEGAGEKFWPDNWQ